MLLFTLLFLTLPLFSMENEISSLENKRDDIRYEDEIILLMAMGKMPEANFKYLHEVKRPVIIPEFTASRDWAKKKKPKN